MIEGSEFTSSSREAIFGAVEGAASILAVLAGLVALGLSSELLVLIGAVQLVVLAGVLAGGTYVFTKRRVADQEAAFNKQKKRIQEHPARQKDLVRAALMRAGVHDKELSKAVKNITQETDSWASFLIEHRLGTAPFTQAHPLLAATAMYGGFFAAGIVVLAPFAFTTATNALLFSGLFGLTTLFILGVLKGRLAEEDPLIAGFDEFLFGAVLIALGLAVGAFISVLI